MTDETTDIVIVGSGAAGLAGALTASAAGASVIVLEKSARIGGTTALSGGLLWVPLNSKGEAVGFRDARDAALEYICRAMGGPPDHALVEAFVDHAAETITFLESVSPFVAINTPYPDTFAELPGGVASGRHLEPEIYGIRRLGKWRHKLRTAASVNPLTTAELLKGGFVGQLKSIIRANLPRILWRMARSHRAAGVALAGALLEGCLHRGVRFELNARAIELIRDSHGAVVGVVANTDHGPRRFPCRKGVLLANGGFEWNPELVKRYLPRPLDHFPSAPGLSSGDNIRLAMQANAELAQMHLYWGWPVSQIPELEYEGAPLSTLILGERTLPHTLWVNGHAKRFCNEAEHNVAFSLEARDVHNALINEPVWAIFDAQYRAKYPVLLKLMPGGKDPAWLIRESSIEALAARIQVDREALQSTLERFNRMAQQGRDEDFSRGEHQYERALGDPAADHPNLGTVAVPPYYAIRIHASAVGTRGGPKIDPDGRVLNTSGHAIPGLFAAGNAAACFYGPRFVGGGATIMPAMTFARLAVKAALQPGPNGPRT